MKALTIWQPWASLIMMGVKPYEFRGWAAPKWIVGKRIAIHAAVKCMPSDELDDIIYELSSDWGSDFGLSDPKTALDFMHRMRDERSIAPRQAVLGTALIGEPIRCTVLFPNDRDADPNKWGWPMLEIDVFDEPVPVKGQQGFWNWDGKPMKVEKKEKPEKVEKVENPAPANLDLFAALQ